MRKDEAIAKLKATEPALRAHGIRALYLFGSYGRDAATPDSDIDVFIDPTSDQTFGFLSFMRAYETIRDALGPGVDLGYSTRKGLDEYIREEVEREAIRVF